METVEKLNEFESRFSRWNGSDNLNNYPFIENENAPFTPVRRSLPMLNLALISAAGAYIDGATAFEEKTSYKEIPIEVEAEDIKFEANGYDPTAVQEDMNSQVPIERLLEYEENAIIGRLNHVWWSLASGIKNAGKVAEELAPKVAERVERYQTQAVILIPASRLCHQTLGIVAREIEQRGIPTMLISVDRSVTDKIRPPRTAYYNGEFGSVAGKPNWKQYQHRILDEAIRWIETLDQPTSRKLAVELETETEMARGER